MRLEAKHPHNPKAVALTTALTLFVLMTGCATTQTADGGEANPDPLGLMNRQIYRVNDFLDRTIGEPITTAYVEYTPRPIRRGVSNFFNNATYPNVILNSFLQGKSRQGFQDIRRFLVNSTFGFLGVWDMASPLGLPAHNEDFGQTLGVWGADEGAYLVLPFVGPNTLRDAPNLGISTITNILFYVSNPFIVPVAILGFIDKRARADEAVKFRDKAAVEPYLFTREAYRQHREFLIHDGDPPLEDTALFDEVQTDPDAEGPPSLQHSTVTP